MDNRTAPVKPLKVSVGFLKSATTLDPATISTVYEYDLIQNLYGRLLRYDQANQLVVDIPSSFSSTESEVTFAFGAKVQSASGHIINAKDAELSLKRLIKIGRSGHGDIRRFLCPGYQLKSLNDDCPGIRVESNNLVLKVVNKDFLPLLLGVLESADYSILPAQVINLEDGSLIDKTHRETSGPYFAAENSTAGHLTLHANPRHYLFDQRMPQVVSIIPPTVGDPIQSFLDGKIDILPTSTFFSGPSAEALLKDPAQTIHETMPFRLIMVKFSAKALTEFTPAQRMYAGLHAGRAFVKHFGPIGGQATDQFFQTLSDGTLDPSQLEMVREFRSIKAPPAFKRPIVFSVPEKQFDKLSNELQSVPEIKVVRSKTHALDMKKEDLPDLYYVGTDTAWTENMSLLGYNFEVGTFSLPRFNPDGWFQNYLSVRDKTERIKILRQLHFDVLMNASIVPIEVAPYYAVSNSEWELNQNKLNAGNELWAIRKR